MQKSDINVSSHLHRWACLRLFFFFHLCSVGRSARTHAGTGAGICVLSFVVADYTWQNDLMCDWVFLGFPCCQWFDQWRLIKHSSPPLYLKLIQKISQLQTVISCWKVEKLNSDSMTFITATLLLQLIEKLVKKNIITGLAVKGNIFCLPLLMFIHGKVAVHHTKWYIYCSYRKKNKEIRRTIISHTLTSSQNIHHSPHLWYDHCSDACLSMLTRNNEEVL